LDRYYTTFPIYNPYLDQLPVKGTSRGMRDNNYKYYDVDGLGNNGYGAANGYGNYGHLNDSRVSSPAFRNAAKKEFGHNDLFYEEYEYERRSVNCKKDSAKRMRYRKWNKMIKYSAKSSSDFLVA
jgi:vang-like